MSDKIRTEFWGRQIDGIMAEIAREAFICDVKILDPGVIEAVLHNNEAACGSTNPAAFKKLRDLLMMGFVVREKAFEKLGPAEADALIKSIREHLQERFGKSIGGSTGHA
jgi:hypothetical protein